MLEYDQYIGQELENNLEAICEGLRIAKEDVKLSQQKYINNKNSHLLLGVDEALNLEVPAKLSPQRAIQIKKDMESYAE